MQWILYNFKKQLEIRVRKANRYKSFHGSPTKSIYRNPYRKEEDLMTYIVFPKQSLNDHSLITNRLAKDENWFAN